MEHNPETRAGCYPSNGQRRMSLEAITLNLRRSSSNDFNYDSGETELLGCTSAIGEEDEEAGQSEMIDADVGDDAGFAAIELLRPPSASMDDPNAQSEDASSIDEGGDHDLGQPSSSRRGSSNGTDLTFMSLEDLLFELQREVGDSVSQSEADRRLQQATGTPMENSRNFVWTEHARNVLESAIIKLRNGKQSEANGRYQENQEYFDTLNKILLPLWPQGWMSPGELGQMIRYLSVADRFEEEQDDHGQDDGVDQYDDGLAHVLDQQGADAAYSSGGESPVAAGSNSSITTNRLQSHGSNGIGGQMAGGTAMCFICDRSFQSPHLLKIHVSHMHTPKALACPECHSRHSTLNGLRFHFSTKHKGLSQRFLNDLIPPLPAGKMVSVPSTNANSTSATATAYFESRPIGSLENSTTTISSKTNSAIRNQLPHRSMAFTGSQNGSSTSTGLESGEVECPSCKNKFASIGALKAHISMMHTEKNIRCRYCPNMYATQRAMLQHTYLKHHKERNCQCPHCGETFRTAGLANLHRRYGCNMITESSSPSIKSTSTQGQDMRNEVETIPTIRRSEGVNSGPLTVSLGSAMSRIRGNGKYHCRDCGASFPMPSAVWAHRKKEHTESTSIKKRGPFSLTDPKRVVGGQIFGQDLLRLSKETSNANGKKKMRVKCSVCSAIFSNGYACYLHKKKIHGEDSIRRELNLSERSSSNVASASATTGTTSSSKPATITSSMDIMPGLPMPNHASTAENLSTQLAASGILGQARMSTSSSSSRDSSPFYRGGDTYLAEGIVRKRYEFHCQCGMTFYNGFAFSRHRQRTGCSDGVRGVVVKESICGVCSEVFPSTELLNEHFTSAHGGTILSSTQTSTIAAVIPKFSSSSTTTSLPTTTLGETDEGTSAKQSDSGKEISGHESGSGGSMSLLDYRSHSGSSHASIRPSQQRLGATATAYVTTTVLRRTDTPPSTSGTARQDRASTPLVISASSGLGSSEISAVVPSSISLERFPIRCLFCPYETLSVEALDEHRRRHDKSANVASGQSMRTCPYCTYVTDSINNYVRHAAIHFSSRGNSGLAMKRTENPAILEANKKRRMACTYCGRCFISTTELMEHEFMHGTGK